MKSRWAVRMGPTRTVDATQKTCREALIARVKCVFCTTAGKPGTAVLISRIWLAGPDVENCYIGQSRGMVFAEAVAFIE
jgi:hypothetical protein